MKFTFDKSLMARRIAIAQSIISNKSPVVILSSVLLTAKGDVLTIKATDSAVRFITTMQIEGSEDGEAVIFCDKFSSILSALPAGNVVLDTDGVTTSIKSVGKRISYKLKNITTDAFPMISECKKEPTFTIDADELKTMLSNTIIAISNDPNRYFMTGVLFTKEITGEKTEQKTANGDTATETTETTTTESTTIESVPIKTFLTMVGTNARRLAIAKKEMQFDIPPDVIVPPKVLQCVIKSAEGDVKVTIGSNNVNFRFSDFEFSSSLISGQYPKYSKVIPKEQKFKCIVSHEDLVSAVKRMDIMLEKQEKILITLTKGTMTLSTPDSELGKSEEVLDCEYDGEEFKMMLNSVFLSTAINAMKTERVVCEFTEPLKAVTFHPIEDVAVAHIIMPMNITD